MLIFGWRFLCIGLVVASVQSLAMIGVCGNRPLPSDRIRKLRNLHLECGSGVDHYIRRPTPFDFDAWRQAKLDGDTAKMQAVGQAQPLIQWKGQVAYETYEVWDWTEWTYGADPVCGYDEETTCTTDKDGKQNCVTTRTMRSCWHDEDRHESRGCSTELMNYRAEYVRPPLTEWNPGITGQPYYHILPNKYDLLPGEVEDVQFFNTYWTSSTMKPYVAIGDAWNKYETPLSVEGASSVACRYHHTYNAQFRILTLGRLVKRTPNAFRPPLDQFGREIDPLAWDEGIGRAGKYVNGKPIKLRLMDASAHILEALAQTTREFNAEIERAKSKLGVGASTTAAVAVEAQEQSGYWQDTQIRIRLFKDHFLVDRRISHNAYTHDSDVSQWWDGSNYVIPLVDSNDAKKDLYRQSGPFFDGLWSGWELKLEPKTQYGVYISMFHKGVPFYKQEGWAGEGHFSKELPIAFKTEDYDERGFLTRLKHWQRKSLWQKLTFQ